MQSVVRCIHFAKVGITAAAGIINFVVMTAAMSGCNSGISVRAACFIHWE
ncbi:hypothetical protein PO124_30680 [Bacillus licheniformis]|nr:hypothetical protein [Bacillus licheniformis]